ncbi:hypothetical protein [Amycolatopsis saalfeldensis]|uniref:Uncharacterized protein n=1 Tax=Amycolatopsis saalfeldensis TaxID=394193 RepID=A0A1H8YP37_9PSEU|nr:hypothetical protein [Amycolatopsis saalfeldensis]SEP53975.1 hypothetical protein SAMN04489732_13430 [Amycolatopsis saalfeldensis]
MAQTTAATPTRLVPIVRLGVRFTIGGHSCATWKPADKAYECTHGFVMWRSQVAESYDPESTQDGVE